MSNQPQASEKDADIVRIAVDPKIERVQDAVADPTFRRYLRRAREGPVAAGDEWAEFVSAGCGSQTVVSVRVVTVEGGTQVGPETTFELVGP